MLPGSAPLRVTMRCQVTDGIILAVAQDDIRHFPGSDSPRRGCTGLKVTVDGTLHEAPGQASQGGNQVDLLTRLRAGRRLASIT